MELSRPEQFPGKTVARPPNWRWRGCVLAVCVCMGLRLFVGSVSGQTEAGSPAVSPQTEAGKTEPASTAPEDVDKPWAAFEITLTDAEKEWLENHPVVLTSADPDWPPYSAFDKNGKFIGIDAALLSLLEERLGIRFEVVRTENWSETMRLIRSGRVELLTGTAEVAERDLNALYTAPYMSFPVAIVMREDAPFNVGLVNLSNQRIASPHGYATTLIVQRDNPDAIVHETSTSEEALLALATGKADAVVENLGVASYLIRENGLTNLKIAGIAPYRFNLHFAVHEEEPELVSIINKALDTVTEAEMNQIRHKWVLFDYTGEVNLNWLMKVGIGVLLLTTAAVGVFAFWNRSMAREIRQRRVVEESLRRNEEKFRGIFENLEEAYFLTDPKGQILLVNPSAARLLDLHSAEALRRFNIEMFMTNPAERSRIYDTLEDVGRITNYKIALESSSGEKIPGRCNVRRIEDSDNKHAAAVELIFWSSDPTRVSPDWQQS